MEENLTKSPHIRFEGFTDEWKQCKFEDIFILSQGLQIPISKRFTEHGDKRYFYITNEFLKENCEIEYYIESPTENVICDKEDILMTRTGNTGIVVTDVEGCFHNNFFKIQYDKANFSKKYIYYLLSSDDMQKTILNSAGSSTIPDLSHKSFYKINGFFPNIKEQIKIGEYLTNLDNVIKLHKSKLDLIKTTKNSMLQKMFPKEGESVPEIRFTDFAENWEQRKLNKYIETSKDKNSDNLYTKADVLSVSGTVGIVNQIEFQGRSFAGASVTNYGIVDSGNIVYTKSPLKLNPHGIIKTNKGKPGIVSTLYAVYKAKENTNPNFVHCYFESDYRLNKYLKPLVNKGAKNDMKVSDDNALLGVVTFPSYDEQTKITQLFEAMDNIIICHQRELNLLEDLKKSMLQQMFI